MPPSEMARGNSNQTTNAIKVNLYQSFSLTQLKRKLLLKNRKIPKEKTT